MVKLTAEQQELFVNTRPKAFTPVPGKWGERGATHVRLQAANQGDVREALTLAWQNHVPKARQQRRSEE